jgi:hypothetical protein
MQQIDIVWEFWFAGVDARTTETFLKVLHITEDGHRFGVFGKLWFVMEVSGPPIAMVVFDKVAEVSER